MIHIGNLLQTYLGKKRISRAALARKMDINLIIIESFGLTNPQLLKAAKRWLQAYRNSRPDRK